MERGALVLLACHQVVHIKPFEHLPCEFEVFIFNLYFEIWYLSVAFNKNGEAFNPKTTQQKRSTTILLYGLCNSSHHKNLRQSLYLSATSILRNAFSISPTNATLFSLNLTKTSKSKGFNDGPTCRQSLREVPPFPSFAEASYTTRTLVVFASLRTTARWGM